MEWTQGVDTWIRRAIALALSSYAIGSVLIGPSGVAEWLCVGVLALSAFRLTRPRPRVIDAVLPVLALGAALVGVEPGAPGPGMPFLLLLAAVVTCASLAPAAVAMVLVPVSCGAYAAALGGTVRDPLSTALDIVGILGAGAGAAGVCLAFRRAARRADAARVASVAVERRRRRVEAKASALADTRRLVHDHLIATLSVVANDPSGGLSRRAARDALRALQSFHRASRDSPGDFALPPTASGADVRDHRVSGTRVPPDVWLAATDAAREALRNAERHAPGARVTVDLRGDRDHLTIVVRDDGQGFGPHHRPGFGLTSSIAARMTEVGGSSFVHSAPGAGTTVTLSWRDGSAPRAHAGSWALMRDAVGSLWPLLSFPLWHLGAQSTMAAFDARIHEPLPALTAVTSVAMLAMLVAVAARRPLGTAVTFAAVVVPSAFVAWGLWLAGRGALTGYESWIVGMADVAVIVLALLGSAWSAAVGALLISAVVFAAAVVDPVLSPIDVPIPLTQALAHAAFFALIARGVRRIGEGAHEAYDLELRSLSLQDRASERSAQLSGTLDALEGRVRRLLHSIAHHDPADDDQTERESRLLARALRDELIVPELLSPSARAGVESLRRRGGSIVFRPPVPSSFAGPVADLIVALAADPVPRACTVALSPHAPATIVVSCRPPARALSVDAWSAEHGDDASLFTCDQSK